MKKIMIFSLFALLLFNLASALTISSVSTPSQIAPGQKFTVSFTVDNNQDNDAENVQVYLDLNQVPFAPYQSSGQLSVDEIRSDRSRDFEFELISNSDAKSSTYKIPVKISYIMNNVQMTDAGLISVILDSNPYLTVSAEDSSLIKGRQGILKVKITNSGLGDAKLLTLRISPPNNFIAPLSSESVYIGNVNSDDFDNVEFKLFINEKAPSQTTIPVQLTYTNSRNVQKTELLDLPIRIYSQDEAQTLGLIKKDNTFTILIGLVVLVVLYFIYRSFKKRIKNRN